MWFFSRFDTHRYNMYILTIADMTIVPCAKIRHAADETQCISCRKGTLPDKYKEFCQEIPEQYLRPESAWAIGAMAFSSMGILVTLFVAGVFIRYVITI